MRDVEPVVAAEAEEEVVARDARDLLRLEAEQLADAVVLVHDVVAGAQVGERLQRAAADSALARRPLPEDLRVGEQSEPELAPDESAARGRDGEEDLRLVAAAARRPRRAVRRRVAAGSAGAAPRRGAGTRRRRALPARTNAFSSFSASASPRATSAGFCASNANGWFGRKLVETRRPLERDRARSPSSSQTLRTSSACQTRSGPAGTGGTRSSGPGPASSSSVSVGSTRSRRRSAAG